jgi:hypothetical protein
MNASIRIPEMGWATIAVLVGCQDPNALVESHLPANPALAPASAPDLAALESHRRRTL